MLGSITQTVKADNGVGEFIAQEVKHAATAPPAMAVALAALAIPGFGGAISACAMAGYEASGAPMPTKSCVLDVWTGTARADQPMDMR